MIKDLSVKLMDTYAVQISADGKILKKERETEEEDGKKEKKD